MSAGNRTRRPLPDRLTDAERGFYAELRRLVLDLGGLSSRKLERPVLAGSLGGYGRAQWDRWLNGEARPPVQVIRTLAELLAGSGIEAGHLPGLWARAFAAAPPAQQGAGQLPRPYQLPPAVAHFTGRAAELQTLAGLADLAAAAGGAVVITAIRGTAGVGKTALAVHWAHHAAARFPDGQLYVNLRGYDPSGEPVQPADAVRWLLEALAVPAAQIPSGAEAQTGLYRSLLAGKRMLIVLDNARDPAQVRPLLPGTPGSMVLVTSRSQLTGLAATDGASLVSLDVLGGDEARVLLARRLGSDPHRRRTRRSQRPRSGSARGCRSPSISPPRWPPPGPRAAARRAGRRPARPASAAGRPGHRRCGQQRPDGVLGHTTAWTPRRRRCSGCWACIPAPISPRPRPPAWPGVPAGQARQALRDLAAAHLIAEHAPGRYAFHDLLRAYASEQAGHCDSEEGRRAAVTRMLDHYLHTADAAAALLCPGRDLLRLDPPRPGVTPEPLASSSAALAWFTAERPVLSSAVTQAAGAGLGRAAWQLGWTTGRFLHRRGYRQEWIAILQTSLAAAETAADLAGQAYVHRDLGAARAVEGSGQDADAHLQQAMDLYRQLGDRTGQAHTHLYLCLASGLHGVPGEALEHARSALQLFRADGHLAGQANALTNAAYGHSRLGEYDQALACCQEALPLHEERGNLDGEGHAWSCLGSACCQLGGHGQAVDCDRRAVTVFRDLADQHLLADALTQLGDHLQDHGVRDEARAAWQEALAILDDLSHPPPGRCGRGSLTGSGRRGLAPAQSAAQAAGSAWAGPSRPAQRRGWQGPAAGKADDRGTAAWRSFAVCACWPQPIWHASRPLNSAAHRCPPRGRSRATAAITGRTSSACSPPSAPLISPRSPATCHRAASRRHRRFDLPEHTWCGGRHA